MGKKQIEDAKNLLKEAFEIPDDDSLKISRNLELIFLHNNRREIPIPQPVEEPKEENEVEEDVTEKNEDATMTEKDAENADDDVEGETDSKEKEKGEESQDQPADDAENLVE